MNRGTAEGDMKTALLVIGIVLFVYGLHWIGQGTGWLPWPANTVMDYNMAFTWYGLVLTGVAVVVIWYSRRT
jgi:uncharacterized membrane protein